MEKSNTFILSLFARKKLSVLAEEHTVSVFVAILLQPNQHGWSVVRVKLK